MIKEYWYWSEDMDFGVNNFNLGYKPCMGLRIRLFIPNQTHCKGCVWARFGCLGAEKIG